LPSESVLQGPDSEEKFTLRGIFTYPIDQQQVLTLARQKFPNILPKSYGHLLVDLKHDTPNLLRLRLNELDSFSPCSAGSLSGNCFIRTTIGPEKGKTDGSGATDILQSQDPLIASTSYVTNTRQTGEVYRSRKRTNTRSTI